MIDLFQEIIDANPNDFELGAEVRSLNKALKDHSHLNMLCEKYPNDQILGEEFRKFNDIINKQFKFLRE